MRPDHKAMPSEAFITAIVALVWNAKREMPAHFTSNGNRTQSFCVDFYDIDPEDEYQMASASWYWVSQYMGPVNTITEEQLITIIRCGEDLMIASYITEKLKRSVLIDAISKELIEESSKAWPKELSIPEVFASKSAKKWFSYCEEYGAQVAQGKRITTS